MSFEHPCGDVHNAFGKLEMELGTVVRSGVSSMDDGEIMGIDEISQGERMVGGEEC